MPTSAPKQVAIIGGGPAGLIAAERLASAGHQVTVYERMASVGRKFLLAGRGGLNLSHSEPLASFMTRYGAPPPQLQAAIEAFPPEALSAWSEGLGEPTFVGTSGRLFPKSFKASPLLRALLRRLAAQGVAFRLRRRWTGWDTDGRLLFAAPDGATEAVAADACLLALGGASWGRLGSDGAWVAPLTAAGVAITPLQPANCGLTVAWTDVFADRFEGTPLKPVALGIGGASARGEAMISRDGLEGGAIYALSAPARAALASGRPAILQIDLRPDVGLAALSARLARPRGSETVTNFLRKAGQLSPVAIGLMREAMVGAAPATGGRGPALPEKADALAALIKAAPIRVTGVRPIDRAISTAGGVAFAAIDDRFMLNARPGTFVAGEMLDWEAPTGGYLLQATFATAVAAAHGINAWLGRS